MSVSTERDIRDVFESLLWGLADFEMYNGEYVNAMTTLAWHAFLAGASWATRGP